jgi:hypothetical protein
MAGLWEPVNGVFWSVSPAVPDEGWPLSVTIIAALVAAFAFAAALKCTAKKIKPAGWHLREHLGEIGGALTLTYLVIVVVVIWGRADTLMTMPLNEVGDFLAGAFGPVAFLWLVFGFLQQGDELRQGTKALEMQAFELRNSVEQQAIMAAAATQQIEAQRAALQLQLDEVERSNRANFVFSHGSRSASGAPGSRVDTSVEIGCSGANAYDVRVVFEPPIGNTAVIEFEQVSQSRKFKIPLAFPCPSEDVFGLITLNYKGADAKNRREKFRYSIRAADPWVKIRS